MKYFLLTALLLTLFLSCKKEDEKPFNSFNYILNVEEYLPKSKFTYIKSPKNGDQDVDPLNFMLTINNSQNRRQAQNVYISLYEDTPHNLYDYWFPENLNTDNQTRKIILRPGHVYYLKTFLYNLWYTDLQSPALYDTLTKDVIRFKTIDKNNYIKDADGNLYDTVNIGNQTWMKQYLRNTTYSNGDSIKEVSLTYNRRNEGYSYSKSIDKFKEILQLNKQEEIIESRYSYNQILNNNNVCPTGWHIPQKEDFDTLISYLESVYGDYYTTEIIDNGSNSTSFSLDDQRNLMSTTKYNENNIWILSGGRKVVKAIGGIDYNFYSIRCIKDEK